MDSRFADHAVRDRQQGDALIAERVAQEAAFLASNRNAAGYTRLLRARAEHNAWEALQTITAPSLALAGQYDMQAPLDRPRNMAGARPNAVLHIIEGGHSICFGHPEPVTILLKSWIHSHEVTPHV